MAKRRSPAVRVIWAQIADSGGHAYEAEALCWAASEPSAAGYSEAILGTRKECPR
jgi:hypothetical protein